MNLGNNGLSALVLHAGPATASHWWADWETPILSVGIALLLVGIAVMAYLIEKRRLAQEES
ncbi:MAG: hypothetical protein ACOYNY_10585 [Caldilineaceae bacterium]